MLFYAKQENANSKLVVNLELLLNNILKRKVSCIRMGLFYFCFSNFVLPNMQMIKYWVNLRHD